jgi:hypothetical protein
MHTRHRSFWEIALPLMAVIIPFFLWSDIVRVAHYMKKKLLARRIKKVCFFLSPMGLLLMRNTCSLSCQSRRKRNSDISSTGRLQGSVCRDADLLYDHGRLTLLPARWPTLTPACALLCLSYTALLSIACLFGFAYDTISIASSMTPPRMASQLLKGERPRCCIRWKTTITHYITHYPSRSIRLFPFAVVDMHSIAPQVPAVHIYDNLHK